MTFEILRALGECLRVGVDHPDILQPGAGEGCQTVGDLHLIHGGDEEAVLAHEVNGLSHCAGGAVVNGEHAVFQFAGFDRCKDLLEGRVEGDVTVGEKGAGSSLGIGTGDALTPDFHGSFHVRAGDLRRSLRSHQHFLLELRTDTHDVGKQCAGGSTQSLCGVLFHTIQNQLLPIGLKYRHVVGFFILCHLTAELHTLFKQLLQLPIQLVDFYTNFIEFHVGVPFSCLCLYGVCSVEVCCVSIRHANGSIFIIHNFFSKIKIKI